MHKEPDIELPDLDGVNGKVSTTRLELLQLLRDHVAINPTHVLISLINIMIEKELERSRS